MLRFIFASLFVFVMAWPNPARADFVEFLASSDWLLIDEVDAHLQVPSCRISTTKTDSEDPIELSIHYPKDKKILPYISLKKKTAISNLIAVKTSKTESQPLFLWKSPATVEEPSVYWYAPVSFQALVDQIRAKTELEIFLDPKGTPIPVKISLKGSSNAYDQAMKCAKGFEAPKDFFTLLNKEKANLTPDLGDRSVSILVQSVQDSYAAFLAGKNINETLAKLRKPAAPLLKKEAAALKTTADAKAKMDTAQGKSDTANALVNSLQVAISQGKLDLENLKAQKLAADQDLAAKLAIYQPLKAQMKPYEDKLKKASADVKTAQANIKNKESLIENNQSDIRALRRELSDIADAIPGYEREIDRLEYEYRDADSEYSRYDVYRETQNKLDSDWSYRNLKNDLDSKSRDRDRAEMDFRQADRQADRAQRALQECRRVPENNCSAQESEYQSADRERDNARRRVSSLDSDINWINSQISWKESSARSDAQSEYDRLRRIRDDLYSDLSSKQSTLRSLYNRQAQINEEIPRLRREIANAEAALPTLREKLVELQAYQAAVIQEKDSFGRSIGFDVAEINYLDAKKQAEKLAADIQEKTTEVAKSEKALPAAVKAAASRSKELEKTKTTYAATLAPLQKIQEELRLFREEEAKVLAQLAEQEAKFKENQARYQDLYKYLADNLR